MPPHLLFRPPEAGALAEAAHLAEGAARHGQMRGGRRDTAKAGQPRQRTAGQSCCLVRAVLRQPQKDWTLPVFLRLVFSASASARTAPANARSDTAHLARVQGFGPDKTNKTRLAHRPRAIAARSDPFSAAAVRTTTPRAPYIPGAGRNQLWRRPKARHHIVVRSAGIIVRARAVPSLRPSPLQVRAPRRAPRHSRRLRRPGAWSCPWPPAP